MAKYSANSSKRLAIKVKVFIGGRGSFYEEQVTTFRITGEGTYRHANTGQELVAGYYWDFYGPDEIAVQGPFKTRAAAIANARERVRGEADAVYPPEETDDERNWRD